jgi:hypothetical protein
MEIEHRGSPATTMIEPATTEVDESDESHEEPKPEIIIIDDEPWELPLDEYHKDGESDFVMTKEEKEKTERITNELRELEHMRNADREAARANKTAEAELEEDKHAKGGPLWVEKQKELWKKMSKELTRHDILNTLRLRRNALTTGQNARAILDVRAKMHHDDLEQRKKSWFLYIEREQNYYNRTRAAKGCAKGANEKCSDFDRGATQDRCDSKCI